MVYNQVGGVSVVQLGSILTPCNLINAQNKNITFTEENLLQCNLPITDTFGAAILSFVDTIINSPEGELVP